MGIRHWTAHFPVSNEYILLNYSIDLPHLKFYLVIPLEG